ncbi:MAG: NAD(P)/FAD-dependent oxidoreductase [Firmicutes bacterium]|nr:NAD(P)/FAD-dependent oxidoreductase [Bacillota bacterium]
MIKNHYHTIIIGAGPAGLACALTLLAQGIDDLLVAEKHTFPRDKCCAGYITRKTEKKFKSFGLDPADCGYSYIEDFRLYFKLKCRQRIENKFLFTSREINRVALDEAFFRLAKSRGVQIAEDLPVTGHDPETNKLTLGKTQIVTYDYLVFADGTLGFGSAYQSTARRNLAMQLIFPSDRPDGIEIHFGVTKRGYSWVSTYQGLTNVGMTDEFRQTEDYKKIFADFLKDLGLETDLTGLYAAFTPIGVRKPVLRENIYFVGDAMGACDPFTLSGINYGLMSGEKAALAIAAEDPRILEDYARKLSTKFTVMRLIMKVFYVPWIHWLVFNVGCRFLSGLVTFFFNRFLNKK